MKPVILIIVIFVYATICRAQETVEKTVKIAPDITEVYHVLKSNDTSRQGLYQARYRKKIALASGLYTMGKRTGIWHFFDLKGNTLENYDYDHNKITYEAPENVSSNIRYLADKTITDTDRVSKPVKPGGRIFGYIPYMRLFKKPKGFGDVDNEQITVLLELLVSPGGRLADYKVYMMLPDGSRDTYNMNIDLLKEEDKIFLPATFNGEPISCLVRLTCYMDNSGKLIFKGQRIGITGGIPLAQ